MKHNNPTTDQHYVPRKFLSAWCNQDGYLFAKRHNDSVFSVHKNKVAFGKKMYAFMPIDAKRFETMICDAKQRGGIDGNISSFLKKLLLLNAYATITYSLKENRFLDVNDRRIIAACRREGLVDNENAEHFRRLELYDVGKIDFPAEFTNFISKIVTEGYDPFLTSIERSFGNILDGLRLGELFPPLPDDDMEIFLSYVGTQIFRTPKSLRILEKNNPKHLPLTSYLLPIMVTGSISGMISYRDEYELMLIQNTSALPFITGDQPLLNLVPTQDKQRYLDLFFPISPNKALFYAPKGRLDKCYQWVQEPSDREVHCLNVALCKNCLHFVFARDKETLDTGAYVVPLDIRETMDKASENS